MEFKVKTIAQAGFDAYSGHGPINIVIEGDSISHGCLETGKPAHYDTVYHNRLRMMINTKYEDIPVNIINTAQSGEVTWYAIDHFERDTRTHHPDLVIICFGLNDVNYDFDTFKYNLGLLVRKIRDMGSDCIYMTPNMMCTRVHEERIHPAELGYAYKCAEMQNGGRVDMFMDAAKKIAAENGAVVCDCYAVWKRMEAEGTDTSLLLANGINHPTREMHKLFADMLYETIFGEKYEE